MELTNEQAQQMAGPNAGDERPAVASRFFRAAAAGRFGVKQT